MFDFDENADRVPFAFQRLQNPSKRINYNSSEMVIGNSNEGEGDALDEDTGPTSANDAEPNIIDGTCVVKILTCDYFQNKLVEYFDVLFKQHKIQHARRPMSNRVPSVI